MTSPQLTQARKGHKSLIYDNPQTITVDISADSSDPWATTTTDTFIGRISHRSGTITDTTAVPAGVDSPLNVYMSYLYDNDILVKGQTITDGSDQKWIIGKPDPLRRFGGIYGYQVALQEVD